MGSYRIAVMVVAPMINRSCLPIAANLRAVCGWWCARLGGVLIDRWWRDISPCVPIVFCNWGGHGLGVWGARSNPTQHLTPQIVCLYGGVQLHVCG